MPEGAPQRYACARCGGRSDDPARCPLCGDEPLVDLEDRDVCVALREADDRRLARHDQRLYALSIAVGLAATVVLFLSSATVAALFSSCLFAPLIGTAIAIALVLKQVLARVWRVERLHPDLLEP